MKMVKYKIQKDGGQDWHTIVRKPNLPASLQPKVLLKPASSTGMGTLSLASILCPTLHPQHLPPSQQLSLATARGQRHCQLNVGDIAVSMEGWNIGPGITSPLGPSPQAVASSPGNSSWIGSWPTTLDSLSQASVTGKSRVFACAL